MRTDQLFDSSVNQQEMVNHLVINTAVCVTRRTNGFPLVRLQMIDQMKSVLIVVVVGGSLKLLEANATTSDVTNIWLLFVQFSFHGILIFIQ